MERKLKERMLEESRYSESAKDEIWERIESLLDVEPARPRSSKQRKQRSKRTMKRIKITTGIAAASLAIAVFLSMPAGTAFMKDVRNWFAPEKKVEIQIEGEKEETEQRLHLNEESKYVIYYDKERYKLVQQSGKDVVTTKEPLPDMYPEVSLTIEQHKDIGPEELIKQLGAELREKYADVREIEIVSKPVAGYQVRAQNGKEWDSEVVVIYVMDNKKKGSFAITERYFLEASEGHGARFEQMLKEFKVLDE